MQLKYISCHKCYYHLYSKEWLPHSHLDLLFLETSYANFQLAKVKVAGFTMKSSTRFCSYGLNTNLVFYTAIVQQHF